MQLFSNSQKAITLQNSKRLGEFKDGKVIYSNFEALYLIEIGKADIIFNNKKQTKENIIRIFSKKDKEFPIKYIVFREHRKKSYIVKAGLKFGGEFRVYSNPKNLKDFSASNKHAKYICYPIKSQKIEIKDLIAKIRISHSTGKKLLLAVVDSENDVLFYEIDWIRL